MHEKKVIKHPLIDFKQPVAINSKLIHKIIYLALVFVTIPLNMCSLTKSAP